MLFEQFSSMPTIVGIGFVIDFDMNECYIYGEVSQ